MRVCHTRLDLPSSTRAMGLCVYMIASHQTEMLFSFHQCFVVRDAPFRFPHFSLLTVTSSLSPPPPRRTVCQTKSAKDNASAAEMPRRSAWVRKGACTHHPKPRSHRRANSFACLRSRSQFPYIMFPWIRRLKKSSTSTQITISPQVITDHMLKVQWTAAQGWGAPEICPAGPVGLHPFSHVFHYAIEVRAA